MTTKRPVEAEPLREAVRESYARIARAQSTCCGPSPRSDEKALAEQTGLRIGYTSAELDALPEAANLGLGCGNPTAISALKPGQTVLDLGSGAGIDVFLAARRVGPSGRVIGVDMTDDMLALARRNAAEGGYDNVEFRKGFIEDLPVADGSIDVILSNCVVNLSPEKERVFAEAYRVLRPLGVLGFQSSREDATGILSDMIVFDGEPPSASAVAAALEQRTGLRCRAAMRSGQEDLWLLKGRGLPGVQLIASDRAITLEQPIHQSAWFYRQLLGTLVDLGGRPQWSATPIEPQRWSDQPWTTRFVARHPVLASLSWLGLALGRRRRPAR